MFLSKNDLDLFFLFNLHSLFEIKGDKNLLIDLESCYKKTQKTLARS